VLDFSKNHFELFDLPLRYRVDVELLGERYRALQQVLHPDRFASSGDREKRLSMQASTRINEAYHTLKDPLERAQYLLSLHGGSPGYEQEGSQDMSFLMEQMELREALATVRDDCDPLGAVGAVLDRLAVQYEELVSLLEGLLEAPSTQDLERARDLVGKLQFVAKCRLEAKDLEAALEGF
jgi:molecular chaperone HscB